MLCPKCSYEFGPEPGQHKCPQCGAEFTPDTQIPPAPAPLNQPADSEQSNSLPTFDTDGPFFERLFNTWKGTLFYPSRFFSKTPTDAGLGRPLLYALIMGVLGIAAGAFWQLFFTAIQIPFLLQQTDKLKMLPTLFTPLLMIIYVIFSPFIVIIGLFLWSGIVHLSLMIFGGDKKGFEATFRSFAYAEGTMLFALIPFCGGAIGGIWAIVIAIIGLTETHKISAGKAIIAYLFPLICCCCCVAGAIAMSAMLFTSAFWHSMAH